MTAGRILFAASLVVSHVTTTCGFLAPTQLKAVPRGALKLRQAPSPGASSSSVAWARQLRASPKEEEDKLPWFIDPGTYGGILVLTLLGLTVPFVLYSGLLAFGLDPVQTGVAMSGLLVAGSIIVWTLSYVFRVFSKKMTYAEQLKRYEDAVIQKRFEELEEDEVAALMTEIEREEAMEASQ